MDSVYASFYTKVVMQVLIREFQSPDEEMKKIVLKVVKQCVSTDGVEADYIQNDILPKFFEHFWVRRMALDRRNYKQLVETTVEMANKVGVADIVGRIVEDLKDESEPYRRMVMETIEKVVANLGASDIDLVWRSCLLTVSYMLSKSRLVMLQMSCLMVLELWLMQLDRELGLTFLIFVVPSSGD